MRGSGSKARGESPMSRPARPTNPRPGELIAYRMFPGPLALGLLAVAMICAGATFDGRRRRERSRLSRPEIQRWEDEGGAIAAESGLTPGQTTTGSRGPGTV